MSPWTARQEAISAAFSGFGWPWVPPGLAGSAAQPGQAERAARYARQAAARSARQAAASSHILVTASPGVAGNRDDVAAIAGNNRRVTYLDPARVLEALVNQPMLRAFVRDGKVEPMPARLSRRRMLLNEVVKAFEPGVRYPESVVNGFLRRLHADWAALRRYLVDEGLLDRADGMYWRSGGAVAE